MSKEADVFLSDDNAEAALEVCVCVCTRAQVHAHDILGTEGTLTNSAGTYAASATQ